MSGALEGIKVLDLSRVYAGPFCTMLLADMGAEVVKIEIPEKGDDTRGYGPYINGESLYYANVNRNKKSITLNLKTAEGKELFMEMVKSADMVVENYRPGVTKRLGVDYETLAQVNPKIIYGSISAFGQQGPYASRPGYDIIAQAMGGLMSITGWPDEGPTRAGNAIGDVLGGISLAVGLLAALQARTHTGKGQHIDVSLTDSIIMSLENATQRYFASGKEPEKLGNRYSTAAPYNSFQAIDGYIVIGCANQKLYELLCENALQMPELINDSRFTTMQLRLAHQDELEQIIQSWVGQYTRDEAVELILAAGVPAAPVMTIGQIAEDEHFNKYRNMFPVVHHPVIGDMRLNGCHIKMSDTMPAVRTCAPALGQHNAEVYGGLLGLTEEKLELLKQKGVI